MGARWLESTLYWILELITSVEQVCNQVTATPLVELILYFVYSSLSLSRFIKIYLFEIYLFVVGLFFFFF